MHEFDKSGKLVFKCSFPLPRGVLNRRTGKGFNPLQRTLHSAEKLMKTTVTANQLIMCRAVLIWYLEKDVKGTTFLPNSPQHSTRTGDEAYKARNLRFVLSCVE